MPPIRLNPTVHAMDHEKVVNNQAAMISDNALAALLDRMMSKDPDIHTLSGNSTISQTTTSSKQYQDNFKVIAERNSRGNVICSDISEEEFMDTLDCLTVNQEQQARDSGCEVASSSASTSSMCSASPEPTSFSETALKSESCSSFASVPPIRLNPTVLFPEASHAEELAAGNLFY